MSASTTAPGEKVAIDDPSAFLAHFCNWVPGLKILQDTLATDLGNNAVLKSAKSGHWDPVRQH